VELNRRDPPAALQLDLGPFECADLDGVDRLARLVLEARRLGLVLHFVRAEADLRDLVRFVGLDDVIAFDEPDA
jgi:hypothetical protein